MNLVEWPACCRRAYEETFYRWMTDNYAQMNPTMSGSLSRQVRLMLPALATLFDKSRVAIRVVDRTALFDAHVVKRVCEDKHVVHVALIGSSLLFLIWRIVMIVGSACVVADKVETGARYRLREPNEEDVRQLKFALETYLNDGELNQQGLHDLAIAFERSPPRGVSLFTRTATLAEIFVILHEVAHEMPFPGVETIALGDLPIHPERKAAWVDELKADVSAYEMLLIGIISGLKAGNEASKSGTSAPSAEPVHALEQDMRAYAFELVACAVTGVHAALKIVARAKSNERIVGMPPGIDPQYRTHPPLPVREMMFENWLRLRTSKTDTPDRRILSNLMATWLAHLADLVFAVDPPKGS